MVGVKHPGGAALTPLVVPTLVASGELQGATLSKSENYCSSGRSQWLKPREAQRSGEDGDPRPDSATDRPPHALWRPDPAARTGGASTHGEAGPLRVSCLSWPYPHPFRYPSPKRPLLPLSMKRVPDYD